MNFNSKFLNIYLVIFVGFLLRVSLSKTRAKFEEKIILKSNFTDDVFTIDMTYANDSVSCKMIDPQCLISGYEQVKMRGKF